MQRKNSKSGREKKKNSERKRITSKGAKPVKKGGSNSERKHEEIQEGGRCGVVRKKGEKVRKAPTDNNYPPLFRAAPS